MPGQGQSLASIRSGNAQRAKQDRKPPGRRDVPVTASQRRIALANRAQIVSSERAVPKIARQQRARARQRAASAPGRYYASLGRQVEREANRLNRLNALEHPRQINFVHALAAIRNQAGAELAGKGELAHLAAFLAANAKTITSTGGGPPVLLPHKGGIHAMSAVPQTVPLNGVPKNLLHDLFNLPAQAVPSLYMPAAGLVEAARGRPQRLHQFTQGIKTQDPIYAALTGDFKRAGRLAAQHPGFTAAEIYGLGKTADIAAGTAARRGAFGSAAKRAAAVRGTPRVVEGTNIEDPRNYPRGLLQKAVAVKKEAQQRSNAARLRAMAARTEDPNKANELRAQANRVDPDRVQPEVIKRRIDATVSALEDVRRAHRSQILDAVDKALKKAKGHGAVSVVAQRIARATPEDLGKYLAEIKQEHAKLADDPALQRANEALQRHLQKALDDPKALPEVAAAADRYASIIQPLQGRLAQLGVFHDEQVRKSALIPYAVRHMGAKHDGDQIVDANGKPLTADAIEAHMRKNGVKPPAYVRQSPPMSSSRDFNVRPERANTIRSLRRTGLSTKRGLFDASHDTLKGTAVHAQGMIDALEGHRRIIGEVGYHERGTLRLFLHRTGKAGADRLRDNLNAAGGQQWRVVRFNAVGASGKQLESAINDVHHLEGPGGELSHEMGRIKAQQDALTPAEGSNEKGPFALVPEEAASQLEKHLDSQGARALGKVGRLVNSAFRQTVLATSPTWFTGNITEAAFRSILHRAGPSDWHFARQVLASMEADDPEAALHARVRTVGGGHYSFAERQHIHTGAEQFVGEGKHIESVAYALGQFWRSPGPREAALVWKRWTHWVFSANGALERQFQTAMLGQELRRAGFRAVDDAAKGLKNTNAQVEFGRAVDRAYGAYSKFGPSKRAAIATYTPFVAWMLNAWRFVGDVLPRDHPTALAAIAASEQASQEWRKQHGLDLFMQAAVPGFLQGSIPVGQSGKLRLSRYLPFGAFSDPTATASQQVLPQVMGVINAFNGKDWKGADLHGPHGQPPDQAQKVLAGVTAFLGGTVPIYSTTGRVAGKGVLGALNPFAVTRPKATGSTEVPVPLSGGTGPGDLPPSVQRALDKLDAQAGGSDALPPSVQRALDKLAR